MSVGIFGTGFSGKAIAQRLVQAGHAVWGTTRSKDNFEEMERSGASPVLFDGNTLNEDLLRALAEATHLIISIAPPRQAEQDASGAEILPVDPVLKALNGAALKDHAPLLEWVGYLSTVGVYGNHDGAWVDEETPVAPASERSLQRVKAENEWMETGTREGFATALFRLSGIYGPGRNALVTSHAGKSRRLVKKDQVFNRIHTGDIAEALHLAISKSAKGVFNITDHEPAPPQDVITFAHSLLGTEPPAELDFETAELSPMARSFYGENKRVSNARSRSELGLVYQYPNYREALRQMFEENSWQAQP